MSPQERGYQAQAILENTLFKEAVAHLEATYIKAWKDGLTVEAREDAHRYIHVIEKFIEHLKSVSLTGEIKRRELLSLEGRPAPWSYQSIWPT